MKYFYLVIVLFVVATVSYAQPPVPMDQPKRTPEEMARKQTTMLVRELNITDSMVIDSLYRINVRHNKRREQGLTRAQELESLQLFMKELRGILTANQFDQFMNNKADRPRHPHASFAPSRPDSINHRPPMP